MITFKLPVVIAASLVALACHEPLSAQVPEGTPASITRDAGLRADGDRARGLGPDYRATFSAEAFEFTPALGSEAPRTMPWRFALDSVRRGGQVVRDDEDLVEAEVTVDGLRCELRRGVGMTERYDVRDVGVEQSFVFDQLPGSGDLVVRGRVTTELFAPTITGADELRFECAPYGGVFLRDVVGIDAAGWRHPGTMNWDGAHLELVLPAEFVDAAVFPIVLDPLVGSSTGIGNAGNDDRNPEVAFSSELNRYLCVWERHFSLTDVEIRGRLRTAGNGGAGSYFAITNGSNVRNTEPTVCSVVGSGYFVVAWQAGGSIWGPFDILGCSVDVNSVVGNVQLLTSVLVPGFPPTYEGTPGSELRPCLSGDPEGDDGDVVLAYEVPGAGIATRPVALSATTGNLSVAPAEQLVVTDPNAGRPSLSSASGGNIAMAYQTVASGKDTIKAVRLDTAGVPNGQSKSWTSNAYPLRNPDIAGDGVDFRIVVEREWALGDNDIQCANISWDGAGTATVDYIIPTIASTGNDERNPEIAFCGTKYVVSWSERVGTLEYVRYVRGIGTTTGCDECGPTTQLSRTRGTELYGAIASEQSGGDTGDDRALVLYTSADIAIPTFSDVRGQLFNAMTGSVGTEFASGCGTPTGLYAGSGTFAIGSKDFVFEASSTNPAQQFCVFSFGVTQQTTVCGCTLVIPDVMIVELMSGGVANYALPLPCDPGLDGYTMFVQAVTVDFAQTNGPCVLIPEASFSAPESWTLSF